MKRVSVMLAVTFLLCGCGEQNKSSAMPKEKTVTTIQQDVQKLQAQQQKAEQKFTQLYNHLKHLNKQVPKINDIAQNQFQQLQANNKKALKDLEQGLGQQVSQVHEELNQFGEVLAKQGY